MTTKNIIADTEHVRAIGQDIGGDTVVVTFNEMGLLRNGTRFWGDDFLLKLRVSAIGVVTTSPNWYPPRDMDEVIPAILAQIGGRRVITYGHSQGGFGSLKFSARLNAYAALSFCPQWTIDPKDCGSFDTRTALYFDPSLGNGVHILPTDVCERSFLFFDREDPADARHVAILSKYEGVYPVPVPFAMHNTVRVLTEGRGASAVINLCRNATPPTAKDFRRIIRQSRRHSKTYADCMLHSLILRASRSRTHSSLFLARLFAKVQQPSHFYRALVAFACDDDGLAQAELANTTSRDFENTDLLVLWTFTNTLMFFAAELSLATHIRQVQPGNTWACLHGVKTLTRAGRLDEAESELRRLSLNRDAAEYASYFKEFAHSIRIAAAATAASVA